MALVYAKFKAAAWWLLTQQGRCNNELICEFKEFLLF